MIPPSTYLEFHLVFLLPAIAVLFVLTWWRGPTLTGRLPAAGLGIVVFFAVVYTTPWDNYLIEQGVWRYGDDAVWHRIWFAPVGEYLFFCLQPILTILFLSLLSIPTDTPLALSWRDRSLGIVCGFAVGVFGIALFLSGDSWLYVGSTLLWAAPILAIQWGFGWTHLWRARRTVTIAVTIPTVYLWIADWTGIHLGLWTISETYTIGIAPFGFPLEEAVFFFITNVFAVQAYILYIWLVTRWPTVENTRLFV